MRFLNKLFSYIGLVLVTKNDLKAMKYDNIIYKDGYHTSLYRTFEQDRYINDLETMLEV